MVAKNKKKQTYLHLVCKSGNISAFDYLMNIYRFDYKEKDKDHKTILSYAIASNNYDLFKTVFNLFNHDKIKMNFKDIDGNTLLHEAATTNNINVVDLLVKTNEIDLEARNTCEETMLHIAIRFGDLDFIKHIVSYGVDVNVQDDDNYAPLHIACTRNKYSIVEFLLSLETIKINIKDRNGRTPLIYACEKNLNQMAKLFIRSKNIDLTSKGSKGNSILQIFCKNGNYEMVKYVYELKKDNKRIFNVYEKNFEGKTALDIAKENDNVNQSKIIEYLTNK